MQADGKSIISCQILFEDNFVTLFSQEICNDVMIFNVMKHGDFSVCYARNFSKMI